MLKKLDILILKSFTGPFIATFFIAFFVLMMQILWKYIDDLVGKGLDFLTVLEFLWYASASLLTLAMPIAILLSSIMTFGNLGESFELVAIKSAGISLLRFMRPIAVVAIALSGITFIIANYVIPVANLKFLTLYNDIYYKKPAFVLKEGVFFTYIPNYAIKVGKKDADGKGIKDILIYDQTNPLQDNLIAAEKGIMKISDDKNFLEFNLQDGVRYQEKGNMYDPTTEYIRLGFKDFKKSFDLSILQKQTTNDSVFRNNYKMLSARQLNRNIDSLAKADDSISMRMTKSIHSFFNYTSLPDKLWKSVPKAVLKKGEPVFSDSVSRALSSNAVNKAFEIRNTIQFASTDLKQRQNDILLHKVEWHRKYALSLACLVLFFIGAPLGSIIRKGGLGLPLVAAIIFFLIFHLLNMFGEKFVKESLASPFGGMWLSIMVLLPVGIFLTYKAMHDSQLFNKELYYRGFKKVRTFFSTFRNHPVKKSTNVSI
ncbi:MAG: LptF/LptG family permease [Ferruginibacter sp.]